MLPSAWRLLIVTNGHATSDWSLGPMLVCVCLGDVCVVIGLSLMFLVFVYVLIRKISHICFITTVSAPTSVARVLGQGIGLTHGAPRVVVECEVKPG